MPSKSKHTTSRRSQPHYLALTFTMSDDDDDFENPSYALPLTPTAYTRNHCPAEKLSSSQSLPPLKSSNSNPNPLRPAKRLKCSINPGKENLLLPPPPQPSSLPLFNQNITSAESSSSNPPGAPKLSDSDHFCTSTAETGTSTDSTAPDDGCAGSDCARCHTTKGFKSERDFSSISMGSQIDCTYRSRDGSPVELVHYGDRVSHSERIDENKFKMNGGYLSNSIESRLLTSRLDYQSRTVDASLVDDESGDFDPATQLNALLNLCSRVNEKENSSGVECHRPEEENVSGRGLIHCPLCGIDISDLSDELRQVHTNDCLDKEDSKNVVVPDDDRGPQSSQQVVDGSSAHPSHQAVDVSPVLEWLRALGLGKYAEVFTREEIDWDTLQWLTEEDLFSIGVTALGPRKKIVHALGESRRESTHTVQMCMGTYKVKVDETNKVAANKLITDYFAGSVTEKKKCGAICYVQHGEERRRSISGCKQVGNHIKNGTLRDIPLWCCVPGTPFRVDAFRYLRRDCSHWFLTHFHIDHYQGLTRSFCHGKIYCSMITARLVNMKIGIPWDRLEVLPLNQRISIAGIDVTCLDANHCPGSIIILFEPPNGKAVLHTGDFRFSEEMAGISALQKCLIHTLILDTTYCNPQYDFPKQEAVIQFVIEAIQAEAFNTKTLFLIGSYTIGKERLFLEIARVLRKKVYVTAAKMRLLECLELPEEDMQWLTLDERESHVHVVPMWTLASFKRLKHVSNQYADRFSLIVAFSPTGWTFGKGKKKSPGRRWQQGTIIRYEVPYSEHCSFTELKEFVRFLSPVNIIPSVNNDGPESSNAMVALLS